MPLHHCGREGAGRRRRREEEGGGKSTEEEGGAGNSSTGSGSGKVGALEEGPGLQRPTEGHQEHMHTTWTARHPP